MADRTIRPDWEGQVLNQLPEIMGAFQKIAAELATRDYEEAWQLCRKYQKLADKMRGPLVDLFEVRDRELAKRNLK
jgi:hypothetical protein